MHLIAFGVLLACLPLVIAWLRANPANRDIAVTAMGAFVFITGSLDVDASVYSWVGWSGTSGGFSLAPGDILALALLSTAKRPVAGLPFKGLMAAFLTVLLVSVTYSRQPIASAFSVWDFGRAIIAFLAIGAEIGRPTAYRALVRGFSLGLMLQAGYVIQQKLGGVVQAPGTLSHQNLLGTMTEIALLNILAARLEGERDRIITLGVLAGIIIVAGGGSRATIGLVGGFSVLLIVLSLIRNRTSGKVAFAAAAAGILALAAPVALMTLHERFGESSLVTEESTREAMANAARAISADHPFGVGANLFVNVSNVDGYANRYNIPWFGTTRAVPVHNAYLLARAETGYHGWAVFVLLLVVPMVVGFRHTFRYRRRRAEGAVLGSATAMAAIAAHSFFEFNALSLSTLLPLAMNIGIIAGRVRAVKRTPEADDNVTVEEAEVAPEPAMPRMPKARPLPGMARPDTRWMDGGLPATAKRGTRS